MRKRICVAWVNLLLTAFVLLGCADSQPKRNNGFTQNDPCDQLDEWSWINAWDEISTTGELYYLSSPGLVTITGPGLDGSAIAPEWLESWQAPGFEGIYTFHVKGACDAEDSVVVDLSPPQIEAGVDPKGPDQYLTVVGRVFDNWTSIVGVYAEGEKLQLYDKNNIAGKYFSFKYPYAALGTFNPNNPILTIVAEDEAGHVGALYLRFDLPQNAWYKYNHEGQITRVIPDLAYQPPHNALMGYGYGVTWSKKVDGEWAITLTTEREEWWFAIAAAVALALTISLAFLFVLHLTVDDLKNRAIREDRKRKKAKADAERQRSYEEYLEDITEAVKFILQGKWAEALWKLEIKLAGKPHTAELIKWVKIGERFYKTIPEQVQKAITEGDFVKAKDLAGQITPNWGTELILNPKLHEIMFTKIKLPVDKKPFSIVMAIAAALQIEDVDKARQAATKMVAGWPNHTKLDDLRLAIVEALAAVHENKQAYDLAQRCESIKAKTQVNTIVSGWVKEIEDEYLTQYAGEADPAMAILALRGTYSYTDEANRTEMLRRAKKNFHELVKLVHPDKGPDGGRRGLAKLRINVNGMPDIVVHKAAETIFRHIQGCYKLVTAEDKPEEQDLGDLLDELESM